MPAAAVDRIVSIADDRSSRSITHPISDIQPYQDPASPARPPPPDPATAAAATDEEEHEALVQAMAAVTADENDDAGGRGSDSSGGSSSSESSSEDEGDLLEELWPRETQAELKYEVSGGRCCGGGVGWWCGELGRSSAPLYPR